MLTSLVLPLFGLLSIYYTFHTLLQYIRNPFLLFLCTVLTIFVQVVFIDQILPYNSLLMQNIFFSNTFILYGNPITQTNLHNASTPICFIYS